MEKPSGKTSKGGEAHQATGRVKTPNPDPSQKVTRQGITGGKGLKSGSKAL